MFTEIKSCLCCGSSNLKEVLNLGQQPWANDFHRNDRRICYYPLRLNLCVDCFHSQLSISVDKTRMFSACATSKNVSRTILEYSDWFSDKIEADFGRKGIALVLSLYPQCNDGSQIMSLKKKGWSIFTVDPVVSDKLVFADRVEHAFISEETLSRFGVKEYDVIVAQNVLAHHDDMVHFLNACKSVMGRKTKLYVQTSQADMIDSNQFDNIYHEHISYFSTKSMVELCKRTGMVLLSVDRVPIYGESYLFVLGTSGISDDSVTKSMEREAAHGRYSIERYDNYSDSIRKMIHDFSRAISQYQSHEKCAVVGYGAAAKGNTFLNASKVHMDFIVDENPQKLGMYTPGTNIPIVDISRIMQINTKVLFVPLAWTFYSEIRKKLSIHVTKHSSWRTYSYFPTTKIEEVVKQEGTTV